MPILADCYKQRHQIRDERTGKLASERRPRRSVTPILTPALTSQVAYHRTACRYGARSDYAHAWQFFEKELRFNLKFGETWCSSGL